MRKNLLFIAALVIGGSNLAQIVGPDAFGYTYMKSSTNSFSFEWDEVDTLHGGTWSSISLSDDNSETNIPLSFSFPFYGTNYNSISFGTNGQVYFVDNYFGDNYSSVCLSTDPGEDFLGSDTAFIAPNWYDLFPEGQGDIYYKGYADRFVIEYNNVIDISETDADTWQVVIYANGDIKMNYKESSFIANATDPNGEGGDFPSIGIQGSPSVSLQFICEANGDTMSDSLTVWYIHPNNTGISNNQSEELAIYPNPNKGQFTIANISSSEFDVKIIDNQGRIVYNNSFNNMNNQVEINLNDVAKGIYMMVLDTPNGKTSERIVIE